eukprot:scaffold15829_cov150-Isochrysis_galbana.AAC.3
MRCGRARNCLRGILSQKYGMRHVAWSRLKRPPCGSSLGLALPCWPRPSWLWPCSSHVLPRGRASTPPPRARGSAAQIGFLDSSRSRLRPVPDHPGSRGAAETRKIAPARTPPIAD